MIITSAPVTTLATSTAFEVFAASSSSEAIANEVALGDGVEEGFAWASMAGEGNILIMRDMISRRERSELESNTEYLAEQDMIDVETRGERASGMYDF